MPLSMPSLGSYTLWFGARVQISYAKHALNHQKGSAAGNPPTNKLPDQHIGQKVGLIKQVY